MREVRRYVLDASIAAKWHLHDEEHVAEAREVLAAFRDGSIDLLSPDHIRYEVSSAIRNAVSRGRLHPDVGAAAIDQFLGWSIPTVATDDLLRLGYRQALQFGCSLYDGLYLALADAAQCRFLYADQRLRNALAERFPLALWISDYRLDVGPRNA